MFIKLEYIESYIHHMKFKTRKKTQLKSVRKHPNWLAIKTM